MANSDQVHHLASDVDVDVGLGHRPFVLAHALADGVRDHSRQASCFIRTFERNVLIKGSNTLLYQNFRTESFDKAARHVSLIHCLRHNLLTSGTTAVCHVRTDSAQAVRSQLIESSCETRYRQLCVHNTKVSRCGIMALHYSAKGVGSCVRCETQRFDKEIRNE